MSYQERYTAYQEAIETYLNTIFSAEDKPYGKLQESIRYSLLAGGKRIRPVLTLEFARLGGIDWHLALPYACALELVHNYSLIHDDLPCMDDDDLRRGKPTNHKVYGETLAVLAGDAMQPEAFRIILQARGLSAENRIEAALILARACGADGMVAGQVLDTLCHVRDEKGLSTLNRLKTGVMISAAAEIITPVFRRFSVLSPFSSLTWHRVSSTWPATMPSAPQALARIKAASIRFSAERPRACRIIRKASGCMASPASTASVSPYTLWLVGLPRRRSSSSMHGRSSWIRE